MKIKLIKLRNFNSEYIDQNFMFNFSIESILKSACTLCMMVALVDAQANTDLPTATNLIKSGNAAMARKSASEALSDFEACRILLEPQSESLQLSTCLDGIGKALIDLGHYNDSHAAFQRAVRMREKLLGQHDILIAESLGSLAGVQITLGQHPLARDSLQRALAIYLFQQGESSEETALCRLGLGLAMRGTADYKGAMENYQLALKTLRSLHGEVHTLTAKALFSLAGLQLVLGDIESALNNYQNLLSIQKQLPDTAATTIGKTIANIAETKRRMGLYEDAVELLKQAIKSYDQANADERLDLATLHYNMGSNYRALHNYDAAALHMRKSIDIRETLQGQWHPRLALFWRGLSIVYSESGDQIAAFEAMRNGTAIAFANELPEPQADMLEGFAKILGRDHPQLAILFGKLAANQYQKLITNVAAAGKGLQKSFLNDNINVYKILAELLLREGRIDEARVVFDCLRTWEFAEFTNTPIDQIVLPLDSNEDKLNLQLRTQLDNLQTKNRQRLKVAEMYSAKSSPELDQARQNAISELANARQDFFSSMDALLKAKSPQLNLVKGVLSEPRTARLEYFYGMSDIYAVLSTSQHQEVVSLNIKRPELKAEIDAFRIRLSNPQLEVDRNAQKLYEILISPILNSLRRDKIKYLHISPDAELRYLPFSALKHNGRYLIQDYTLSNQTARVNSNAVIRPHNNLKLAQFGSSIGTEEMSSLVGVRPELEGIAKAVPSFTKQEDIYLDQTFTRENVLRILKGNWNVVHFATHFVLKPGNETDSFMLLGNGSKLSLKDWRNDDYDFSNIYLVSLSACETAISGKNAFGKEIDGLAMLFQKKGARAVISTLWKVDDLGASKIMPKFYQGLGQGKSIQTALRLAQLSFLKKGHALNGKSRGLVRIDANKKALVRDQAHPYFWAPFLLMQNAR